MSVDKMIPNRRRRFYFFAVAFIMVVHVLLVLHAYPVTLLLKGEIPILGDVSRYFASTHSAVSCGGMYGYDPYFMAGFGAGLWDSVGRKGFQMLHILLPFIPLPALFYLTIVSLAIAFPILVWLVLRKYCPTTTRSMILLALYMLYWHIDTQLSYLWHFGNIFYPATAIMLLLFTVCGWEFLRTRGSPWYALGGTLLGVLIFYCHPDLLVAGIVSLLVLAVFHLHAFKTLKVWLSAILALASFSALVAPWLIPLVQNLPDYQPLYYEGYQGTWRHLIMDVFSDRAYRHHFDRNLLLHMAVVFGCFGLWRLRREGDRGLFVMMGMVAFPYLLIAYGASHIDALQQIGSYRYLIHAVVFLCAPAAVFIEWVLGRWRPMTREGKVMLVAVALVALPAFTAYLIDFRYAGLAGTISSDQKAVMNHIGALKMQGRLLCDDIHFGHLIPYHCRVPVIGGSSAHALIRQGFAGFDYEDRLFGKSTREWNAESLGAYLGAYNVEVAVFSRDAWINFAEANPDLFVPDGVMGEYRIYRVSGVARGYVYDGLATASADYNSITVSDATAPEIVLKYHHVDWLKASQGVRLVPRNMLDDPAPFIKCVIPDGVRTFAITRGDFPADPSPTTH